MVSVVRTWIKSVDFEWFEKYWNKDMRKKGNFYVATNDKHEKNQRNLTDTLYSSLVSWLHQFIAYSIKS